MMSMIDRFRHLYDYERDCNAKALAMLASVPNERRDAPEYAKALGKMAHLAAARQRWLCRIHGDPKMPPPFPDGLTLEQVQQQVSEAESVWTSYLAGLSESDLARTIDFKFADGVPLRWTLEGILTTLVTHAPYHRGQVALLVSMLGGKAVDTDYLFFAKPERIG